MFSRPTHILRDKNLPYCPFARHDLDMPTQGMYEQGYPVGAVIHYTAGRSSRGELDAINTILYGKKQNLCYFCISSDGEIFQTAPLDRWGYHAGPSSYPSLGEGLSKHLVGIEVCCAGRLEGTSKKDARSWFGERYDEVNVRQYIEETHQGVERHLYHKFTDAQETMLRRLLIWLKSNNPTVFNFDYVLGHEEITDRKFDPGASLSVTMPFLRNELEELYTEE